MTLPVPVTLEPMLARLVEEIPRGDEWAYEPKWDGFRCLAFRDGDRVELQSKSGQSLGRYFPEVVEAVRAVSATRFVLDGEIVIPSGEGLSFDDLLQRIHPASSRVARLSRETPALLVVFDLLAEGDESLLGLAWARRRRRLERFAARTLDSAGRIRLSPATRDAEAARRWLRSAGGALDGVVAKQVDLPYKSGDRTGMRKIKFLRTADCVVGGFRFATRGHVIGSLLLGLYDEAGALHHVGFCSGLTAAQRSDLTPLLEKLIRPPGFTGRAPGGPSRWSTGRSAEWKPLAPRRVVEVQYDHFSQGRFRHGTRFLRWRPDKAPRQCTLAQVETEARALGVLTILGDGRAGRAAPRRPRSARSGR